MNESPNTTLLRERWPEGAVVYHIYPRSFQDSNGDGVGDLKGIEQRLDYLQSLGVTALWLSPFYPSPMADFGYDIADYYDVDELFGTLDDFRSLLTAAHNHDIKVIIDLVPNHTSDAHQWFIDSSASRDNPKSDWYIWRDAKDHDARGNPIAPNNWLDVLTGHSAWQWNETRGQFYLHSFDVRQPDLNWTNPEVREAFKNIMRYWLDMGVDGFRVDAVYWLAKDPLLHDDPENPKYRASEDLLYEALLHTKSCGWPPVYAYLSEMCDVLKEPEFTSKERFMVTEAYPERHNVLSAYLQFYVGMDPAVAAPFNFEGTALPWEVAPWRDFLSRFHTALDELSPLCVASYAFGNHDKPRVASRIGVNEARSAAVMLLTLPGMAFIYYGEELGMQDVAIPIDRVRDPAALGDPKNGIGRDPERTPMQWSAAENAGFTQGTPWLPIADDYTSVNVETQSLNAQSSLTLYRTLGTLRRDSATLKRGSLSVHSSGCDDVLAYDRALNGHEQYVTYVNFADQTRICTIEPNNTLTLVVSSAADTVVPHESKNSLTLQAHEAAVFVATTPS